MNKKKIYPIIFAVVFILDIISKRLALEFLNTKFNYGLFLGIGSNHIENAVIVALGTLGLFMVSCYVCFLMRFGSSFHQVKLSLSILCGGIAGNVLDRILYGKTIDFIPGISSYFNLADTAISLSIIYLIYLIFSKKHAIFRDSDLRYEIIVNKKEQFRIATYFAICSFLTSSINGVFLFTYFKYYKKVAPYILESFPYIYIGLIFITTAFFFNFGLFISHKSVGPIHAFEKYIRELINNKESSTSEFKLRESDDYKHLETLAKEIKEELLS